MLDKENIASDDISFKKLFVPLTKTKAIHWIIIIGLLVYGNMLFNGFVWDDRAYIIENPEVHSISRFLDNFYPSVFNNTGQYRPLVANYFTLAYYIFGANPFPYHILQLFLHILCTIILYFFIRKIIPVGLAYLVSIIFLIQPMQVESVSYISASGGVISFLFGITALLLSAAKQLSLKKKLAISLLLFLSILTKESGVLFIVLLIIYQLLFRVRNVRTAIIIIFLSLISYIFLRINLGGVLLEERLMIPIARLDFIERIQHIPIILYYYFKTYLFPVSLSINQQWIISELSIQSFYLPLMILVALSLFLIFLAIFFIKKKFKYYNAYIFFIIWFVFGVIMFLQILPGDMTVADRWFYNPIVGLSGIVSIVFYYFFGHIRKKKFIIYLLIIGLVLLSFRTIWRNFNYFNEIILYTNDKLFHNNFDIENNLSIAYRESKQYELALEAIDNSIRMFPLDLNYYNKGKIYEEMGDIKKAMFFYEQALNKDNLVPWQHKHYLQLYTSLCRLYVLENSLIKAKKCAEDALLDWPNITGLVLLLAVIHDKLGNEAEALKNAEKAYLINQNELTKYYFYKKLNHEKIDLIK